MRLLATASHAGGLRARWEVFDAYAIARAIVNDPDIILADEPTGALDNKTGDEVISIFKKLNDAGKTIIIVTHNSDVASSCHRIIEIRDGKIV